MEIAINSYLVEYSKAEGNISTFFSGKPHFKIFENAIFFVIVDGNIFNMNLNNKEITELWTSFVNCDNEIDGEYSIIIYNKSEKKIIVSTDIVASKKIFIKNTKECLYISNNIFLCISRESDINKLGLAQYLANGFTFHGETLVKGIFLMRYAEIVSCNLHQSKTEKYWDFKFSDKTNSMTKEKILEFDNLYKNAISKRTSENNIVSFSGGYESTSNALMLLKNKTDFKTVTYYGTLSDFFDKRVARKQAEHLGLSNRQIKIIRTHNKEYILKNVILGMGSAKYCRELNVIEKIKEHSKDTTIFFGEECFGITKRKNDLLSNVNMFSGKDLKTLYSGILKNELLEDLSEKLDSDFDKILTKYEGISYDKKVDLLFFDLQISNVYTGWRYFYWNTFFTTANPLLDKSIINFNINLADNLRNNKPFFIKYNGSINGDFYNKFRRAGAKNYLEKIDLLNDLMRKKIRKLEFMKINVRKGNTVWKEIVNIIKYFIQLFMYKLGILNSYKSIVSELVIYERLEYIDIFNEILSNILTIDDYSKRIELLQKMYSKKKLHSNH